MQRSGDIGTGLYGGGLYLGRWTMADGYPRCIQAPLILADADPHAVAATIAVNRAVAGLCAQAEAVEAAAMLAAMPAPPETMLTAGPDGEAVAVANPAHAAWVSAGALLADAAGQADLQHLLRTRAGTLTVDEAGAEEAGWVLSLPPVPTLDPLTQTADWDGADWIVRDLTGAEAASWPLRPPPVPATVTRTQLRLALSARNLLDMVDAAVTLSGDTELIERWGAAAMERSSPHLAMMAAAMGLSAADIDDIFRAASAL